MVVSGGIPWLFQEFRRLVRALQCDNGREFDNNASRSLFTHGD
jgi:hypothetical protein